MRIYFAKSTGGFYNDQLHGPPAILIDDQHWQRPTVKAPHPLGLLDETGQPLLVDVPDDDARAPLIEAPNPGTLIPADAVEIPADEHRALIRGEDDRTEIVGLANGQPALRPRRNLA